MISGLAEWLLTLCWNVPEFVAKVGKNQNTERERERAEIQIDPVIRVMITIQYNSTFHKNSIEMWLYTQTSKKWGRWIYSIYSSKWQVMISGQKKSTSTRFSQPSTRHWGGLEDLCTVAERLPSVLREWYFQKMGVPQHGWFIKENPIKMDDLRVPLFLETPRFLKIDSGFEKNAFQKTDSAKFCYCWWKKSCTTWDVWNSVNNEGIYHINR